MKHFLGALLLRCKLQEKLHRVTGPLSPDQHSRSTLDQHSNSTRDQLSNLEAQTSIPSQPWSNEVITVAELEEY